MRRLLIVIVNVSWVVVPVLGQCHWNGDVEYCERGSGMAQPSPPGRPDCHFDGNKLYCLVEDPSTTIDLIPGSGDNVTPQFIPTAGEPDPPGHGDSSHGHGQPTGHRPPQNGIAENHGGNESEPNSQDEDTTGGMHGHSRTGGIAKCDPSRAEGADLTLRIASIFIILATSTLAVLAPIGMRRWRKIRKDGLLFTAIKQFGTGIIIATVFIHLLTHAFLQFLNPCLGDLHFESTANAIAMAGVFVAFLVDYSGLRYLSHKSERAAIVIRPIYPSETVETFDTIRSRELKSPRAIERDLAALWDEPDVAQHAKEKLHVLIMEAGMIFHSVLLGVLLTVTPAVNFPLLLTVIALHQLFEGLALGARIATLAHPTLLSKAVYGLVFAVTAPVGMAIGLAVRGTFNGNDPRTIATVGAMDAFSAGVLAWVAVVEMWSEDWLRGSLSTASGKEVVVGLVSLGAGAAVMVVLGIWQ